MKTAVNERDNLLVSYWPAGEKADTEIVKLLFQLDTIKVEAKLAGSAYAPVIEVKRNGHNLLFRPGMLLVVHSPQQMAVLPNDVVEKVKTVLQLDLPEQSPNGI